MNIALILASGTGERFGQELPKQYTLLNGKASLQYVIEAIAAAKTLDEMIIVATSPLPLCKELAQKYHAHLIDGGATRNLSMGKGLDYIHTNYPNCDKVLVTDAVRPLIPATLFDSYMEKLTTHDVVVTCRKITDEVGCKHQFDLCRNDYFLMSSPQAYRIDWLYKYYDPTSPKTEVLYMMPPTINPYYSFEFPYNFKLTWPWDKPLLESLLHYLKPGSEATDAEITSNH